jgi:hypothetical protein
MSSDTASGPRSTSGQGAVTGRVRSVLGTRGQRSHPARPQPEPHRLFRLQPPPFV